MECNLLYLNEAEMDLLLDKMASRVPSSFDFFLALPEMHAFKLSTDLIAVSDRMVKKILENLQQGLKEHTQRSIQQVHYQQQLKEFYSKIFNSMRA
jgi:hypothetical protein